ncbi:myeloid differentiation primary response protein MyD88-like [Haliotis rubra]|uniref:myeloid differentiation primary response protein MyD88-like n=1 Tax=Haliotis rubra TaxID=36100 RepID=UPI001EE4F099|nr:myeloid differentiation primary response protein MyD88-like [Haliotis rubra]
METDRSLRLCIPDRDFHPGDCTAEEILDAINNSWKTVIYLTETFLEDELCSFMLSSAVYASTNLMPNRLIILYSDDIFDHPLPRILTQLLDRDNNFPLDTFDDNEQWDQLYSKHLVLCLKLPE